MEKFISIRERLRKIPPMSDEGVESRSDGVHRIHWKGIDSNGKDHFLLVDLKSKGHWLPKQQGTVMCANVVGGS